MERLLIRIVPVSGSPVRRSRHLTFSGSPRPALFPSCRKPSPSLLCPDHGAQSAGLSSSGSGQHKTPSTHANGVRTGRFCYAYTRDLPRCSIFVLLFRGRRSPDPGNVTVQHDVVAQRADHDENMEDFVRSEIDMSRVKGLRVHGIDRRPHRVGDAAGQQPGKGT